jgi:hypothetical protein
MSEMGMLHQPIPLTGHAILVNFVRYKKTEGPMAFPPTRKMTVVVSAVFALIALVPPLVAESCKQTAEGACFTVHGRYEVDSDKEVIWIIGTHRELMVDEGLDSIYAAFGNDDSKGYDHYVIGNFTVCPLEKARIGEMRRICVRHAANLRRIPRQSN